MAEPIKTTIQEAFDHIKSWIAEGSKEKAIQGLNEILNFDPTNAEAQKLLLEVKTSSAPAAELSTNPTPTPAAAPAPMSAPAPMPTPAPVMASAPMPPPMPPISETPMQPPSVMPPKAVPMTSVSPAAAVSQAPMVAMLMGNMKLIIAIGGVIIAIVAGYIFYKGVLSSADVIKSEVESVQNAQTEVLETTTPTADTATTTPDVTTTPDATITTTPVDATTVAPAPADTTPAVSDPNVVEATTGKVKRK